MASKGEYAREAADHKQQESEPCNSRCNPLRRASRPICHDSPLADPLRLPAIIDASRIFLLTLPIFLREQNNESSADTEEDQTDKQSSGAPPFRGLIAIGWGIRAGRREPSSLTLPKNLLRSAPT
jgi:hypothetical protein